MERGGEGVDQTAELMTGLARVKLLMPTVASGIRPLASEALLRPGHDGICASRSRITEILGQVKCEPPPRPERERPWFRRSWFNPVIADELMLSRSTCAAALPQEACKQR